MFYALPRPVWILAFSLCVFNLHILAQGPNASQNTTRFAVIDSANGSISRAIKNHANLDRILALADTSIKLAEDFYPEGHATSLMLKSRVYRKKHEYQPALRSLQLALSIGELSDSLLARIHEERARVYLNLPNFVPALESLEAAIMYYQLAGEKKRGAIVNYLRGNYYKDLNRILDAIKSYQTGLSGFIALHLKHPEGTDSPYTGNILTTRMALAQAFARAGEIDSAFRQIALGFNRENWEGFYKQKAMLYGAEGRIYETKATIYQRDDSIRQASLQAARISHQNALDNFERANIINDNVFQAYINLGITWENAGEFEEAIKVYEQALTWYPMQNWQFKRSKINTLHIRLGESYMNLGKSKRALEAFERIEGLPEDQAIAASRDMVATAGSLLLQNNALSNRKQMEFFRLATILLIVAFGIGILFSYRRRKRKAKKQQEIFVQTQAELNQQIRIEAQQKIVEEIGDMIHRDRCAEILACAFTVNGWKMEKEINPAYSIEVPDLEGLRLNIVNVNDRLRDMTDELKNLGQVIESKGLQDLAQIVVNRFKSFRFHIDYKSFQLSGREFPIYIKHNMYCIMGEAMKNIAGSKDVKNVSLQLIFKPEPEELTLTIIDDGVGFDVKQTKPGNGIANMRKYAIEMGAELQITSRPNPHTMVHCCVQGPFTKIRDKE